MKKIILMFMLIALALSQGCGSSLYSENEDYYEVGSEDYIIELLNDATSTENYTAIVDYAQSIISDNASTNAEKASAYTYLGEALLGTEGVNLISVLEDVAELESMSEDDLESGNIFDLIDIDASADTLKAAADAFSSANELSTDSSERVLLKESTETFEMTNDQLILAGFANLLYVIKSIQIYFDIDSSGSVSLIDENETFETISASLIDTNTIHVNASASYSFFNQTGAFATEQLEVLENVSTALTSYSEGWAAYSAGTSYTYNSVSYDFSNESTKASSLEQLVNAIFEGASS